MKLYGGIDLHSNNSYIVLIESGGTVIARSREGNEIGRVLQTLAPYREQIESLVVESTYNWYWLVDGLQAAGYAVKLANPSAMQQYAGLKYSDDRSDARWLAEMLRLGIVRLHLPGNPTAPAGSVAAAKLSGQTGDRSAVAHGQYLEPEPGAENEPATAPADDGSRSAATVSRSGTKPGGGKFAAGDRGAGRADRSH